MLIAVDFIPPPSKKIHPCCIYASAQCAGSYETRSKNSKEQTGETNETDVLKVKRHLGE